MMGSRTLKSICKEDLGLTEEERVQLLNETRIAWERGNCVEHIGGEADDEVIEVRLKEMARKWLEDSLIEASDGSRTCPGVVFWGTQKRDVKGNLFTYEMSKDR